MRKFIRKLWRWLPHRLRAAAVRSAQSKFTVSVAAVIIDGNKHVLILDHVLRPKSGWGLPGGFVDRGEQPAAAIRREIREETGIELNELDLFTVRIIDRHVEMIFTAAPEGNVRVNSTEILGFDWFAPEDLPVDMSNAQKNLITRVLSSVDT